MIISYKKFVILERLGISQDVEVLSNYLKSKITDKSLTIDNIPLKLSKPINKIFIDINRNRNSNTEAHFDIGRSSLTNKGYDLYLVFSPNPTLEFISHEVSHAFQFIMKGREQSLHDIDRLKSAKLAKGLLPFGAKNSKLNEVVDLIYYLSDSEIDSYVVELYSHITQLSKKYKIDKVTFQLLVKGFESYEVCKFVDSIELSEYLKDIPIEDKIKFFSILKEEEFRLKNINIKNNLFRKISNFYHFFKMVIKSEPVKKIEVDELHLVIDKWNKYFKIKSSKLKMKLFRLYDLFL